ncbi:ATP-binding cassette domain-containing protein [Spirosoma montaniterrae]|uniref:ABC transporter ATP-binding protein n=1 Tax=Spirosoma montaniterrae TaxID=1178516 RepID=A0A1P9WVY1_9BACT|nr:ABC transporter ATP-binding protein [Spirosoma montaniterrae]AQG79537.1 ABC transporter ATP-binding protein [Spirosoma montaniterrae]
MIDIQRMSFRYQRNRPIYDALTLTLSPGNVYGLLAPNGAGKSTLLRLMAGLLYPTSGQIRAGDYSPADRKPAFLEDMFFVPEEFYLPPVRIRQFIDSNAPFYPRFDRAQMAHYLREFDLTDNLKLSELSYGQKKKVLIGFGLATNTAVLLMDEPTNGLDIPSKSQFRRLVAGAIDERRTVVISTHQVRDLEALIDPIVILAGEPGGVMNVGLNASVEEISARLWFGLTAELDLHRPIVYSERTVGGYAIVAENHTGESSRLDLERLYNAVQTNPARIKQLFSSANITTNA